MSDSEVIKLADFGIARATDQSSITQVGSVLGTAAYLSPEQARGEEAGPRADIYSLGVVTYQLLSGRLPYEASSLSELALKQQRELPTPLYELSDGVPPELAAVVAGALSIEQEGRPPDALSFGEALRSGERGIAPPPGLAGEVPPTRATRLMTGAESPTAATRVAPRTGARTAVAPPGARRLEPRYAGEPQAGARYARTSQPPPRPRRSGRGLAVFALLLVVIAAVVVAVVIATGTSRTVVRIQHIVAHDFQSAYDQFKGMIDQYTK